MSLIWIIVLVAALQAPTGSPEPEHLFLSGKTWEQFLDSVSAQRELWLKTESTATAPPDLVERAKAVSHGLRLVIVAEDWCPDSAYTVPYVASLARSSGIPLRIVDRVAGEPLLVAHRTPDGRTATPTIVLWREGRDVGAWVERPAELQRMFLSMSTSAESAQRFSQRHTWYESDRGLTALRELLALIEQTREKK
jgi:hypothetical protein